MTRGNQREIDRQRAANRNAKYADNKNPDGLTPQQRNERDAAAMAEKKAMKVGRCTVFSAEVISGSESRGSRQQGQRCASGREEEARAQKGRHLIAPQRRPGQAHEEKVEPLFVKKDYLYIISSHTIR